MFSCLTVLEALTFTSVFPKIRCGQVSEADLNFNAFVFVKTKHTVDRQLFCKKNTRFLHNARYNFKIEYMPIRLFASEGM